MMMKRVWINIILLLALAYGAYGVLGNADNRYTPAHWPYYLYVASPWLLLVGALKAWYRSFIWRRMVHQRQAIPILSRGEHRIENAIQRPSILEYASIGMVLLALAAILEQFSVSDIPWWIGSLVGAWIVLRITLKKAA